MAKKGETSYVGRLKDEIKKNEKRIKELEDKLKEHDENCQPKIDGSQEEIRRLQEENNNLRREIKSLEERIGKNETKIEDLERSNTFLEEDNNSIKETNAELKKQLKEHDRKLKELHSYELSEDELVIRELCAKVQQNILKIALRNHFDKIENKSLKHIEKYISNQIEEKHEQDEARSRFDELKKQINWDDYLLIQLKPVTKRSNKTAHPILTEEIINVAKMNLEAQKELGKRMVKAVDRLTDILKHTNDKLAHGISSAEGTDQDGRKNRSASGRKHDTSAGTATKGAQVHRCGPLNGLITI